MNKGQCLLICILALFTFAGCSGERPGYEKISATWEDRYSITSWETGPLLGGTAVLVNGFAGYWLKDGVVFATNGVAKGHSDKIEVPYAPPSVDQTAVEKAIQGKGPEMPPSFPIGYKEFTQALLSDLKPAGFRKNTWRVYSVPGVRVQFSEAGGMVTEAEVDYVPSLIADSKAVSKAMTFLMKTLAPQIPEDDQVEILKTLLSASIANLDSPQTAKGHGVLFSMVSYISFDDRGTKLTARPIE